MKGIVFILLIIFCACTAKNTFKVQRKNVKFARHFDLIEEDGYRILRIFSPENGQPEKEFALVKRGARVTTTLPVIQIPIQGLGAFSTTHIGMLSVLGSEDKIKVTTGKNYISNRKVLAGIQQKKILALDSEQQISAQRMHDKKVNVLTYSGFGRSFPKEKELEKIGIQVIANYDWREIHPLGKAEWIKVYGALLDKKQESEVYFNQIVRSYSLAKKDINHGVKPTVLMGSLIGSIWYAPAGKSYMAQILEDAGVEYLYKNTKGTGSIELTLNQVFKDQKKAEFWLNSGVSSLKELKLQQPRYVYFETFKKGNVYCYTHASNYFWEMGAVHPDWILQDIATLAGTAKKPYLIHFYNRLK